jgi:serine/threonine protein kinase
MLPADSVDALVGMWWGDVQQLPGLLQVADARLRVYLMPERKQASESQPVEGVLRSLDSLESVTLCGQGGSGSVYHCVPKTARSERSGLLQQYAVKVAHSSLPNGRAALMKEWSIMSRIQNFTWAPALITTPWEGAKMGLWLSSGERCYLGVVMEYLHPDVYVNDLNFWRGEQLPVSMMVEFVDCLLQVLSELHCLRLQHGDIKDCNMSWTRNSPCRIKLTDYGGTVLVKRSGPAYGQPRLTVPGFHYDACIDHVMDSNLAEGYTRDQVMSYISAPESGQLCCVGERGSQGYRHVDMRGEIDKRCLDTFAVGVLICHAATSCATKQLWTLIREWCFKRDVPKRTAEIMWTECLLKVVISSGADSQGDDDRWSHFMKELWGYRPGFCDHSRGLRRIRSAVHNLICKGTNGQETYQVWRELGHACSK